MCVCVENWKKESIKMWYVYVCTHHIFIHSSVDGHLGCFRVLPIVNSAAINAEVLVSFRTMFFSRGVLRIRIAGSYGSSIFLFFVFLKNLHTAMGIVFYPTHTGRILASFFVS